jgi:hypothetical protein
MAGLHRHFHLDINTHFLNAFQIFLFSLTKQGSRGDALKKLSKYLKKSAIQPEPRKDCEKTKTTT